MSHPRFAGVPFFLGGRDLLIPALSLGQVETHYDTLAQMGNLAPGQTAIDVFRMSVPVIGAAVRRNYPEITDAELFDWIDLANFKELAGIVQAAAGFETVRPGEAPAPALPTGASSTQA